LDACGVGVAGVSGRRSSDRDIGRTKQSRETKSAELGMSPFGTQLRITK
jgi:hypothetical protein